jgi:hypothetical protein
MYFVRESAADEFDLLFSSRAGKTGLRQKTTEEQ